MNRLATLVLLGLSVCSAYPVNGDGKEEDANMDLAQVITGGTYCNH